MPLPTRFCWTRFGAEAGESAIPIFARNEAERIKNGGVFLWGIGNAIGPSIRALIAAEKRPRVIFSPIKSSPREKDVAPGQIVRWNAARGLDGGDYIMPPSSLVTSRAAKDWKISRHYALVCASTVPLMVDAPSETFSLQDLRNFVSGNRVGASQVTSVVSRRLGSKAMIGPFYRACLCLELVYPYFVQLFEPTLAKPRNGTSTPMVDAIVA